MEVMRRLGETGSEHLLKQIYISPPPKGYRGGDYYLPRVFIEYLPGGDLKDFLNRQSYKRQRISERTAWEIFFCLMKGAAAMNTGTEDPVRREGMNLLEYYNWNPNKDPNIGHWRPWIHHDLKPMNSMLTYTFIRKPPNLNN